MGLSLPSSTVTLHLSLKGCTAALSSTAQVNLDFILLGELAKHTVSEAFTKFTSI